jgi:hypothetical protein
MADALQQREKAWQRARQGIALSSAERKLVEEAETLRGRLVAAGRWACRADSEAQAELTRIAEGGSLADTVQDLVDLRLFWKEHEDQIRYTRIRKTDLPRADELVKKLRPAAEKEAQDGDAALALELRNRVFWAADALAKEIREGGRYAFDETPKLAAKFVSRYRTAAVRRSRKKAKQAAAGATPAVPPPIAAEEA